MEMETDDASMPAVTQGTEITTTEIVRMIHRVRTARARSRSGLGADVANVLAAAPSMLAGVNATQAEGLLEAYLLHQSRR